MADWSSLDLEKIANAVVILVVGLAAGLGWRKGAKAEAKDRPSSVTTFTDAADVLAITNLTGEVTGLTLAQTSQAEASKEQTKAIDRLTEAIRDHMEQIHELRDEMSRRR